MNSEPKVESTSEGPGQSDRDVDMTPTETGAVPKTPEKPQGAATIDANVGTVVETASPSKREANNV